MGVKERKERKERERAQVRALILDAAREMFAADGVDAVTMRAIAERIDYSAPVIYSHFQDKETLLQELCYEDFRALGQAFRRIERIDDPVERLRRIGRAYVEFALEHPSHYRFMFLTPKTPGIAEKHAALRGNPEEDAYAFLCDTVAEALASGRFRPELDDVEELAQTFWASAHGVVSLQLVKSHDKWIDWRNVRTTSDLLIDATLRGVLRESK